MAEFTVDIRGRINNTNLPESKYLWALLEAVVNSIQSIEESTATDGKIEIYAKRLNYEQFKLDLQEAQVSGDSIKPELSSFESFSISDNGCGFTTENYTSFITADSSLKWNKGCKGIGRFLWLKAFEKAHIESNFKENNQWQKRNFSFTFDGTSPDENISNSDIDENKTIVTLEGFKNPYRDKCPKTLEALARKIIEHCLVYFLLEKCPKIILLDSSGDSIDLNMVYESTVRDSLHQDHFALENNEFIIYHVRVPEGANAHELHFCANKREVRSIGLDKVFPNLQRKINDGTETGFYYCGYLTSSLLDKKVNNVRTGFDFENDQQLEIENNIPERKIIDAAKEYVSAYLKEYIDEISTRKMKHIDNFVAYTQPQYRLLLNQRPGVYDSIKPDLSDNDLELALHAEVLKWDMEAKQRGLNIKDNMANNGVPHDEFMPRFEEYCKEVTTISKISLSEYVIRRRVILDLLEVALEKQEDGSYMNEDQIHSIICPMRYTSNELNFNEMNLWIINEKLVYHSFLASDKQTKELPIIDSNSMKRMDVVVFDEAFSFAEKDNPISAITIVEFKKPYRNDLDRHDNDPIDQVLGYVEDIKLGKKTKANGRSFGNVQNIAFYCYVIADLTDTMRKSAKKAALTPTPDGEGFFGYNPGYGAYIEVISYDKLLKDAQDRNRILFDKLLKPSPSDFIMQEEQLNDDEKNL